MSLSRFKSSCKKELQTFYQTEWKNNVNNSRKCYLYKGYKTELKMEEYLYRLPNNRRITVTKFRLCNHKLPIELGRHYNIDRKYRICTKCNLHDLGDEFHYVCICPKFNQIRKKLIPKKYFTKPSVLKFCELLCSKSKNMLLKLSKFAHTIMKDM